MKNDQVREVLKTALGEVLQDVGKLVNNNGPTGKGRGDLLSVTNKAPAKKQIKL